MFETILLSTIFGLPLIAYGGIITFILITAALILGLKRAPIKVHMTIAVIAAVIGLIHGILGILAFI